MASTLIAAASRDRYSPIEKLIRRSHKGKGKGTHGGDKDAGADLRLTDPTNAFCDKIGDDVGIEQIAHQSSTGSGYGSKIGGNSSSSDAKVASMASSDLDGVGSIIARSPSLRMIAFSPGNSNSRGIRAASLWHMPKHISK
jgi:hypothetical protein